MIIQCSSKAYAKCPTRALCGRREDAAFAEGSECDLFNRMVENQPMTTLDRIRAMCDKDLVGFIWQIVQLGDVSGLYCKPTRQCMEAHDRDEDIPEEWCKHCLMEWLASPAAEVLPK